MKCLMGNLPSTQKVKLRDIDCKIVNTNLIIMFNKVRKDATS